MIATSNKPLHGAIVKAILFVLIAFIINVVSAQTARGTFLDYVEVKKDVGKASTNVHLRLPVRYLGHFPPSEGRVLKIRFQPMLRQAFTNIADESVSPPLNDCPVIRYISLDHGMGDEYYLTYHFKHSVRYEVTSQTNSQEMVVVLRNPHIDEAGDPCDAR